MSASAKIIAGIVSAIAVLASAGVGAYEIYNHRKRHEKADNDYIEISRHHLRNKKKKHEAEENVDFTLSELQLDIISKTGLPKKLDDMTEDQKKCLNDIVDIMTHAEQKYNRKFKFLAYHVSNEISAEVIACTPEGDGITDTFTITRCITESNTIYDDDFSAITAEQVISRTLESYLQEKFNMVERAYVDTVITDKIDFESSEQSSEQINKEIIIDKLFDNVLVDCVIVTTSELFVDPDDWETYVDEVKSYLASVKLHGKFVLAMASDKFNSADGIREYLQYTSGSQKKSTFFV